MSANNEKDTCIICHIHNSKLISNTYCTCKYKYHNKCWKKYIHHTKINNTIKCVCCKSIIPLSQPIEIRPTAPPIDNTYYQIPENIPDDIPILIETSTQISENNVSTIPVIITRTQWSDLSGTEKRNKLINIIIMLGITIIIIIFLVKLLN
jgi:hypothetical protein